MFSLISANRYSLNSIYRAIQFGRIRNHRVTTQTRMVIRQIIWKDSVNFDKTLRIINRNEIVKIEKTFVVNADRETVWQFITSPQLAGKCIPGCQEVTEIAPGKYSAVIKIQMGAIKTYFMVDVETVEENPPNYLTYTTTGQEGTNASRINAKSTIFVNALDENTTEVKYTSNISISGRLGKFGLGIMRKKADSIGDEFVQNLCSKIECQPIAIESDDVENLAIKKITIRRRIISLGIILFLCWLIYIF